MIGHNNVEWNNDGIYVVGHRIVVSGYMRLYTMYGARKKEEVLNVSVELRIWRARHMDTAYIGSLPQLSVFYSQTIIV